MRLKIFFSSKNNILILSLIFSQSLQALQETIETFIPKNFRHVESQQNYLRAKAEHSLISSQFYPRIELNGAHATSDRSDGFQTQLGLNANQTIFGGGSEYPEFKASRLRLEKAQADFEDVKDQLRIQLLSRFSKYSLQEERIQVLNRIKTTQEERIRELRRRVNLGQSREPDLLQAQVEESRLNRRLSVSLSRVDALRQEIMSLFEISENDLDLAKKQFQFQEIQNYITHTYVTRPDYRIQSLRLNKEALAYQKSSAEFSRLPNLSLYGQQNLIRPNESSNKWEWGLRAQWTLFEGFRTPAQIKIAKSQRIIAEKNLFSKEYERQTAFDRLKRDEERIQMQKKGIEVDIQRAERALRQQERDYRLGLVTELEVQQTLQSLLDLQIELLDTKETLIHLVFQRVLGGETSL
jgi:outer membrane protein